MLLSVAVSVALVATLSADTSAAVAEQVAEAVTTLDYHDTKRGPNSALLTSDTVHAVVETGFTSIT